MYIIKTHYEATEKNRNFAGDIQDWYTGKGGWVMGDKNVFPSDWQIEHGGYPTLAGAKRGLKAAQNSAEWEMQQGFWKVSVELVEC